MDSLNLPSYEIKIAERDGRTVVFDTLRRRFVALTPEEWVRQHFVHYLLEHKHYPIGLLANEVELRCGDKRLRCDSVLYDPQLHPKMIVEYKAPTVKITQKTFEQIFAYNLLLHVDYLIVSNGLQHFCCKTDYDNRRCAFLKDVPDYQEIV